MDRQKTDDGKPFAPIRYEQLVTERYYVTKFTNTSYTDAGQMSPRERELVLKRISEELIAQKENSKKLMDKMGNNK